MPYTQNETSFLHEKKSIYITFHCGEIKCNFVSKLFRVKRPIKNANKPERDIDTRMLEATIYAFIGEVLR